MNISHLKQTFFYNNLFSVLLCLNTESRFLSTFAFDVGVSSMNEETHTMKKETEGLAWRVSLSILVGVGWLVFLLVWLIFYAKDYAWERNVAIFLLSLLVIIGILGVPWAYWAIQKTNLS